ncbi:SprT family zinc-dependent metalloprotease [Psychrobacter sp. FBL11]|uniref:SprT family zinc-dependent metalloprotease n=1 Tax=Psychrobacter saeujeotis TaxID=3143436 RepID=A0ABU9XB40_9GAMM|nr:SprT family zinc-dependent metalloprotease [uncultured Psychrobacter sp.]
MIVKSALIKIGELDIHLTRKDIKNLHISVMPPDGQVRVSAPDAMTDTAIRMAVIHRIPWIRRQQAAFAKQERQSTREMVNGETHYLWGKRYRLEVIELDDLKSQTVKLKSGKLILTVNKGLSDEVKIKLLSEYYRGRLKARAPDLIDKWSKKTGVTISDCQIQKMKTKWGSCNIEEGNIRLNLDLAKKPLPCLEYIILHELLHFKERQHNDRFKALLATYMPDWRSRRDLLNQMPLGQENWKHQE